MKNILVINGHPNKTSFNFALAKTYNEGVLNSGNTVIQEEWSWSPNCYMH